MKKKRNSKCLFFLGALVFLTAAMAGNVFASSTETNDTSEPIRLIYDFIGRYSLNFIGNTNHYALWDESGKGQLLSRNYKDRKDLDSKNNSTAVLSPTNDSSKIKKAYLIWETRSKQGSVSTIQLYTPSDLKVEVPAQIVCRDIRKNAAGEEYTGVYCMAADVTSIICSSYGGYGSYTVADIPVWEGALDGVACGGESVASWQLVIVEESLEFPLRTVSLNLMSQYFFNVDYTIKVDFADASNVNGVVTAQFLDGKVDITSDTIYDGIGYEDDYNYESNGNYYRYKTPTRGLYKNGVCINDRDQGKTGSYKNGGVRLHLFDDFRREGSIGKQEIEYLYAGKGYGANVFLFGVAIDISAYDIKFDGNGADSGEMENFSCIYGRAYNLPENEFNKNFCKFVGWNTKQDGSGETYEESGYIYNLTDSEETITLYAQWQPIAHQIRLDHQDAASYGTRNYYEWYGVGNYSTAACFTTIDKIILPEKKGHFFDGYYTEKNGNGIQQIDSTGKILSTSNTFTKDTVLYAKWIPAVYKITLDHQNADKTGTLSYYEKFDAGNYTTSACTVPITDITNPTKAHHVFKGYYTEKNGEGQRIIDEDGTILQAYTFFDKDTTLYAYWESNTYTITLDHQGAVNAGSKLFYEKYGVANYLEYSNVYVQSGDKTDTFAYTGKEQIFEVPYTGWYHLEAWGAQGGSLYAAGFSGGFASGDVYLKQGDIVKIYVGGHPSNTAGGYNGGGDGRQCPISGGYIAPGGGATDFRVNGNTLANRVLIAGGGGGSIKYSEDNFEKTFGAEDVTSYENKHYRGAGGGNITGNDKALYKKYSYATGKLVGILSSTWKTNSLQVTGNTSGYVGGTSSDNQYFHGTLGKGNYGGGGGYCGGGYEAGTDRIFAGVGGTGYVGGVKNGIMIDNGAETGTYFNTGHGRAYITYQNYKETMELKTATSIVIPKKSGYVFGGYYSGKNGSGTCYIDADGNILAASTTFTANTTLYAKWTAADIGTYQIVFHGNGADEGRMSSMICEFEKNYTLNSNQFSKKGYRFLGWSTEHNGSIVYSDKAIVKNLAEVSGDIVMLYAQWTPTNANYEVHHYTENIDGGWSLYTKDSKNGEADSSVNVTSFKKTLAGFTYSHAEVKGTAAENTIILPDGSLIINLYYTRNTYELTLRKEEGISDVTGAGNYKYQEPVKINAGILSGYSWYAWDGTYHSIEKEYEFVMPNEDVTMTATTSPAIYKITLDNQSPTEVGTLEYYEKYGKGNYAEHSCSTEIAVIKLPKKVGYAFGGYYSEKDGNGNKFIDENGTILAGTTEFLSDTILYAQWIPKKYTVHFDSNGGEGFMEDIVLTFDQQRKLPFHTFIKQTEYGDSVFLGWNLSKDIQKVLYQDGAFVINIIETEETDVTLYAIWDDCPWIVAEDLYYTLEEAKNGMITYSELMSQAAAKDREDGEPIFAGVDAEKGTSFTLLDYRSADFTQMLKDGSVDVTYQVIDSSKNEYRKTITVYIVDTTPIEIKPIGTTRFITEKYYEESFENGGLEENSIWKTDSEYISVIEKAFENSKNNTPIWCFEFTYEEIEQMKKFVQENGVGNSKKEDALQSFYNEFMLPNIKNN